MHRRSAELARVDPKRGFARYVLDVGLGFALMTGFGPLALWAKMSIRPC